MIYIVVFAISLLFSTNVKRQEETLIKRENKVIVNKKRFCNIICMLLSALPLIILASLRYGIGTDYFNYIAYYERVLSGSISYNSTNIEVGFFVLCKILALFSNNSQMIIVVTSIIFVFLVYKSIYMQAVSFQYSLLLFLLSYNFFTSFNNIRQSLASSIVLFGIKFLSDKDLKKYVITVAVATLIHNSVVLMLILVIVEYVNVSAIILCVTLVAWKILGIYLLPTVIQMASKIPFLDSALDKYQLYYQLNILNHSTLPLYSIIFNSSIMILLVVIEYLMDPEFKRESTWKMIKYVQFLILFFSFIDGLIPAVYRFVQVFSFSQCILLPITLRYMKNGKVRSALVIFYILGFMGLYVVNAIGNADGVFPYTSILT